MKSSKITLFFIPTRITLMHTLYPIYTSKYKNEFLFTSDLNFLINNDKNKYLFLVGGQKFWTSDEKNFMTFQKLRDKYVKIIFFEDNASPESQMFKFLPYIDVLYKRSIYKNIDNYSENFVGNRLFTNYYKNRFNVKDDTFIAPYYPLEEMELLEKIELGWNIGFGYYPLSDTKNKISKLGYKFFGKVGLLPKKNHFKSNKPNPQANICQARFDYKGYRPLIGFQRKIYLEKLKDHSLFLTGKIPLKDYNIELKNVQAVLSPFGWGEVCFRDFEAVFNGSVLIKPNMDHLVTYPDIFKPNITYISIDWDGVDLIDKTNSVLGDQKLLDSLSSNAWEELSIAYNNIDFIVEKLIAKILN